MGDGRHHVWAMERIRPWTNSNNTLNPKRKPDFQKAPHVSLSGRQISLSASPRRHYAALVDHASLWAQFSFFVWALQ